MPFNRVAPTIIVSALLLSACATGKIDRTGCAVTDSSLTREGRSGVVLTNTCTACIAVGFEYVGDTGETSRTACFVPSETRVVYWGAHRHRVLQQRDCEAVRTDGMRGLATAAEVAGNHRTGACEILGVFAD